MEKCIFRGRGYILYCLTSLDVDVLWELHRVCTCITDGTLTDIIISPKFENFGDIMVLVAPPSPPPSPPPPSPPPHANACTGHNFVTNTPIKFIFAIAIEVPDYKNPMIFVINRKNKMASGGHFV